MVQRGCSKEWVYNNEIICFNTGDFSVNKASTIFIQDTNNNQMIGKILSIQYNNQDIDGGGD